MQIKLTDIKLINEIEKYCKANGLIVGNFVRDMVKKGFMIEKYGTRPFVGVETVEKETKVKTEATYQIPLEEQTANEGNNTPLDNPMKSEKPRKRTLL